MSVNIDNHRWSRSAGSPSYFWLAFLGLFGVEDKPELTGEDRIIHMVKLAKLSQQKGEAKKAEQLFHLALRAAQDLQHKKAESYIIDEMANHAFQYGDHHKAEKLFIDTIKKLVADGSPPDANAIIHISGKLACLYALVHDDQKAQEGFRFCTEILETKIKNGAKDFDTLALQSLILGWYGEFLYSRGNYEQSMDCFQLSHSTSVEINGPSHEQSVLQLNNIAATLASTGKMDSAITQIKEVILLTEKEPTPESQQDLPCFYLNLANLYLRTEQISKAEESCRLSLKQARQVKNEEAIREAENCLKDIDKMKQS